MAGSSDSPLPRPRLACPRLAQTEFRRGVGALDTYRVEVIGRRNEVAIRHQEVGGQRHACAPYSPLQFGVHFREALGAVPVHEVV